MSRPTGTGVPISDFAAQSLVRRSEPARRPLVEGAAEVVVEHLAEDRLVGRGVGEQRHRRLQLHARRRGRRPRPGRRCRGRSAPGRTRPAAGRASGGRRRPAPRSVRRSRALRHPAAAEPGELREDEPHPVRALLPGAQLVQGLVVGAGPARRGTAGGRRDRSSRRLPSPVPGGARSARMAAASGSGGRRCGGAHDHPRLLGVLASAAWPAGWPC